MGLLSIFTSSKRENTRSKGPEDDFWYNAIGNGLTDAGKRVTSAKAEQIAAVFACETAICQSMGMLPGSVLSEADERKKEPLKDHPLWKLLRVKPNPLMDALTFKDVMQRNLLQNGNAYAFISRSRTKILSLLPLDPTKITTKIKGGEIIYRYVDPNGEAKEYESSDIFHLKCFSKDGITGRSPIKVTAETVGFSLSLLEHSNNTFESGAALTGLLKVPSPLKDDEARSRLIDGFRKYIGRKSPAKIGLLEGGSDFVSISQNNQQSQLMELSKFSVEEIARIYRVPPQFIQAMEKGMSYASVEQLAIAFVQYTIQPWITLWESAIKAQLLEDEDDVTFKFNISALIRGDLKSKTDSIIQQLSYGLLTINEARDKLDYNASEEEVADKVLVSHNLIPAENIGKVEPSNVGGAPEPAAKTDTQQFNSLFDKLFERIIFRERRLIGDRSKKSDFQSWFTKFEAEHRDLVRETLEPAVEAMGLIGSPEFESFLESYAKELRNNVSFSELNPGLIRELSPKIWRETLFHHLERGSVSNLDS